MPTHYFLANQLVASTPKQPWWSDQVPMVTSVVYLCKHCGETWGRVLIEGADWSFQIRDCEKHGGGSFIASWCQGFADIPEQLLARELQLLLNKEPL